MHLSMVLGFGLIVSFFFFFFFDLGGDGVGEGSDQGGGWK